MIDLLYKNIYFLKKYVYNIIHVINNVDDVIMPIELDDIAILLENELANIKLTDYNLDLLLILEDMDYHKKEKWYSKFFKNFYFQKRKIIK